MNKHKGIYWIFVLAMILACASCGPNYVYETSVECSEEGWPFEQSLEATFEIVDSNVIYNLHLVLEHSTEFPFQNFYTKIHTNFPNGEQITEQLSLELADKRGVWLGDCGGETCELDILIQQGAFFNQLGTYKISVEQFSRQDPLKGIESVHFLLEDTGQKR